MNHQIHHVNPITDEQIAEALADIEADAHDAAVTAWGIEQQQLVAEGSPHVATPQDIHTRLLNLRRERETLRAILRGTERHLLSIERGEVVAITPGLVEDTRESVRAQRALMGDLEQQIQELGAQLDEMCDAPASGPRLHWRLSDRVGGVRILTRPCAGGSYETCARREDGRLMGLWRWGHKAGAERGHVEVLRRVWHALLCGTELG